MDTAVTDTMKRVNTAGSCILACDCGRWNTKHSSGFGTSLGSSNLVIDVESCYICHWTEDVVMTVRATYQNRDY
jgi:hypothetical protein